MLTLHRRPDPGALCFVMTPRGIRVSYRRGRHPRPQRRISHVRGPPGVVPFPEELQATLQRPASRRHRRATGHRRRKLAYQVQAPFRVTACPVILTVTLRSRISQDVRDRTALNLASRHREHRNVLTPGCGLLREHLNISGTPRLDPLSQLPGMLTFTLTIQTIFLRNLLRRCPRDKTRPVNHHRRHVSLPSRLAVPGRRSHSSRGSFRSVVSASTTSARCRLVQLIPALDHQRGRTGHHLVAPPLPDQLTTSLSRLRIHHT